MRILTRWTSADLLTLPQDRGLRDAIIDGDLYVSLHPSLTHQQVCGALTSALGMWCEHTGLGACIGAPGIVLASGDAVIPDVVWISHQRLDGTLDQDGHLTCVPELVVEVLAPGLANQHRDREAKHALYCRQGVDEYWIVDPQAQDTLVHRFAYGDLVETLVLFAADTLTSPLLPGFACPVHMVFRTP